MSESPALHQRRCPVSVSVGKCAFSGCRLSTKPQHLHHALWRTVSEPLPVPSRTCEGHRKGHLRKDRDLSRGQVDFLYCFLYCLLFLYIGGSLGSRKRTQTSGFRQCPSEVVSSRFLRLWKLRPRLLQRLRLPWRRSNCGSSCLHSSCHLGTENH